MIRKWFSLEKKDDSVLSKAGSEGKEEWALLEKVIGDANEEQKRSRQWGIFFKLLTFLYLFLGFVIFLDMKGGLPSVSGSDGHTALVKLNGRIAEDAPANANDFAAALRAAFEHDDTKAVIIAINSPGGSPVQSEYMYKEINRLKEEHKDKNIKVYAVISDMCASGGYYVAAAADEIYASEASLVGSIGVTSAGFGFVDSLEKLGIERRDYTSGKHKSFLDPFQPSREDEIVFWQGVLEDIHQLFIQRVREGRGEKLVETEDMFSGLIWNGMQAKQMGLIDGFASAGQVARDIIEVEDIKDFSVRRSPFSSFMGGVGVDIGRGISQDIKEQSLKLQ